MWREDCLTWLMPGCFQAAGALVGVDAFFPALSKLYARVLSSRPWLADGPSMNARVHPQYKTKYRVTNWAEYERALVQRVLPSSPVAARA